MDAAAPTDPVKVRVTVFNQVYNLATTGNPADLEECARRVDVLMTASARGGNLDAGRIAVLAAIHLVDQLRQVEQAQGRLDTVARRLEEVMGEDEV
jgi:cell division protein ZapA (FtsZ GTPase activity inhibitor)